jgi:hypothetical protein
MMYVFCGLGARILEVYRRNISLRDTESRELNTTPFKYDFQAC